MKNCFSLFLMLLLLIDCQDKQESYPPVGQNKHQKSDMDVSIERNKAMNEFEREEIQKWIDKNDEEFYIMPLNYWVSIPDLSKREKTPLTDKVSFAFYLYDFDEILIYDKPISYRDIPIEKIPKLQAVRDVMQYLKIGEEATLLVPSALAYATQGDENKIEHDIPLIIKIKRL